MTLIFEVVEASSRGAHKASVLLDQPFEAEAWMQVGTARLRHSAAACGHGGPSITGTGMGVCTIRHGDTPAYRHSEPAHSLLSTSKPTPPTAGAPAAWGPAAASAPVLCGDLGPLRRWAARS